MKIIDMHIHARNEQPDPKGMLAEMKRIGVYGGCVFSTEPDISNPRIGTSFEERLEEVLSWSKGYEDRIFPVVWIHPYEENIIEKIRIAVERGIVGFKMICDDYYVYEEGCMEVLREIAKHDKPVFFHSGILWDEKDSSKRNRPIHWEALVNIEGLRFSMGHCSWPWIDECVAMFGKFMFSSKAGKPAEMFFDVTPGTPEIYREELFRKLYLAGYETGHNIMFGTDATADVYNRRGWVEKWLKKDRELLEEIGVSKELIEDLYYNNFMRFLGKTPAIEHKKPDCDDAGGWSPENPKVREIIEKWYKKLEFPSKYDEEFYLALDKIKVSDIITVDKYNIASKNGKRNLLSALFMCERLSQKYKEKGIDEKILLNTLRDLVIWTNTWSNLKGELYLGQFDWLCRHLEMSLFRIGRLQFGFGKASCDIAQKNVKKGDNIIEVHIPEGEPLSKEVCLSAIEEAKAFFNTYYPEYEYKCFTCGSWLLDETLKNHLRPESNILKFQELFEIVKKDESDAILRYIFRWDTNIYNVKYVPSYNSFTEKVRNYAIKGGKFFEAYGYIK